MDFQFNVVPYNPQHNSQVAALEKKYFSSPWSEKAIADFVEGKTSFILVALNRQDVIGYVSFYYAADEGYIANIAVDENYRNNGVASKLIDETVNLCKSHELYSLGLEVRKSNENAEKLYIKKGFTLVGTRKNFYDLPKEDALLFTLFL